MEASYHTQSNKILPDAWQHDKALGDCMIKLYENNLWTDVKFKCKGHDGNECIHAHKIVLAARSPVFQAMFYGPCADGTNDIVLDSTEAETFDLFLRYIYMDKVDLTESIAASVLETAHYYQVSNLVEFCAAFLATCLTIENVCEILSLARCYEVSSLCTACCIFIDQNAGEVIKSEGFLKLTEDNLMYMLKGDTFYEDEVVIFKKAEEWAQKKLEAENCEKNGQNIRKVFGSSFFYVRLPTMSLDNLLKCTRRKGYFSAEEYEDIVDFINKSPDRDVDSNSCISRVPTKEHLFCSDEEQGTEESSDGLRTCFNVTVRRDVKLKTIRLAEICKSLKEIVYTKFVQDVYSNPYSSSRISFELREPFEKDLFKNLHAVLLGTLKVTSFKDNRKGSSRITNVRENFDIKIGEHWVDALSSGNAMSDGGVNNAGACLDSNTEKKKENENEYLIFEQDLKFFTEDETQRIINLKEPILLEESRSPFTFKVNLDYKDGSSFKTKAVRKSKKVFTSEHGVMSVENVSGNLAGIQSLSFENISNR
ncbi:BTB/POZ domain-containing protein 6-B-like isoform X2 [Ruditapes philippinarum]|nr:BTB/POZ domain-containing protein 6-B-like isoform X2 [Ruditapes philippinarum]